MPAMTTRDSMRLRARTAPRIAILGVVGALGLCTSFSGCQAVADYQPFELAPPHRCDDLPTQKSDDRELAAMVLTKPPNDTCFWIDKTEVTVQQYSKFLEDVGTHPLRWKGKCDWKSAPSDPMAETDHECAQKLESSDPFDAKKPIRCIDWCDAGAYCEWAGKRLCGGDGNASGILEPSCCDDWGKACSVLAHSLPYGDGATPEATRCNVGLEAGDECYKFTEQHGCGPARVGSFEGCEGPYGTLDQIGNVAEWVDTCVQSDSDHSNTRCQSRGGAWNDALEEGGCYNSLGEPRGGRFPHIGVRCCADLTPSEESRLQ